MSEAMRLKVMVTAFACSPEQGSEPGIGWGWVVSLSKVCELTVITPTCNRDGIQNAIRLGNDLRAQFIYLDVLPAVPRLNRKAKTKLGVMVRLLLWQWRLGKKIPKIVHGQKFDILHHLTLGSFRFPFSVTGHGVMSVVGPVGGGEEFPEPLLPELSGRIKRREMVRNWLNRLHTRHGLGMGRYSKADLTLSCTNEMRVAFARHGVDSPVFPNIGMPDLAEHVDLKQHEDSDGLRLLFVGNLLYWKGLELALLALAQLPDNVSLTIIGSGSDRAELESDIERMGLGERVDLMGAVPRDKLLNQYREYDLFFYPSVHDSGAMSVIEAMRAGLPVVCLDAGGPGISVTEQCGRVIPIAPKMDVIKGLQEGVEFYLEDLDLIVKHGEAAIQRVNEKYFWDENAHCMIGLYQSLING
jgi:glycosyltransferase involved in cell wall biosynthesis